MSRLEHGSERIQTSQPAEAESRVLSIETDDATPIFNCLSSATARQILATLHDAPQTASDLAETSDTSIQNVRYHLEKFQKAELIEVVDSRTSSRGKEMDVFGPTEGALVLYGGQRDREDKSLGVLLRGVLSAVGVLAGLSLAIEAALPMVLALVLPGDTAPGDGGTGFPDPMMIDIGVFTVTPGLVFFSGGLLVLLILTLLGVRYPDFLLFRLHDSR